MMYDLFSKLGVDYLGCFNVQCIVHIKVDICMPNDVPDMFPVLAL